jgi:hypothetical protein
MNQADRGEEYKRLKDSRCVRIGDVARLQKGRPAAQDTIDEVRLRNMKARLEN